MTLALKRRSLAHQVADAVRAEILGGVWSEWIPSERELSRSLHVSRNTCRSALHALYRESLIEPIQGRGIRLKSATIPLKGLPRQRTRSVGVIIPEVLGHLRPQNMLVINELQEQLYDMEVSLHLHNSAAYNRDTLKYALKKLVDKNHHDCWILLLSNRALQSWFMQRELPCLVAGSIYPGIALPSIDYDYRAICRHAAGRLISLGHRRIVFINRRRRAAGDLESEAGFHEGAQTSSHGQIDARLVYHDDNLESVSALIKQMFTAQCPPTGILVANSFCYLSVATALGVVGRRVPADVSLISRDDDHYLAYVDPVPARYLYDGTAMARKVISAIRPFLDRGVAKIDSMRIAPRFTAGCSLGKV